MFKELFFRLEYRWDNVYDWTGLKNVNFSFLAKSWKNQTRKTLTKETVILIKLVAVW